MKLAKKLGLLVAVLFCIQWADAQIGLRIYKNDFTPSSVTLGDSFTFNAIIRNDSNSVFNGPIGFAYKIDTAAATAVPSSISGLQFDTVGVSLNPGDTVLNSITVHVSGPQFMVGPSVVVIWPIATGTQALDSLILNINVLMPMSVADIDEHNIKAYIINNSLMVQAEHEIQLKQVRIYDILGREILNQRNPSAAILLPVMGSGVYLTEIIYNNNQRKVFRFFK